jgi:hypothetical protein
MQETTLERDFRVREGAAVRVTSPAPRSTWYEIMQRDPEALVTQSPEWTDVICEGGDYVNASRLYEFSNRRMLVLPMVRQANRPFWLAKQSSMPSAWGIGGVLGKAHPEELEVIGSEITQNNALSTSIRPNPLLGQVWGRTQFKNVISEPRLAHVLDLSGGFEHVWSKKFSHEAQHAVRKAEKSGLTVECDTTGRLVPVYYELYMNSVERWAAQQHEPLFLSRWRAQQRDPIEKIMRIAKGMGQTLHTWVAWLDGKPAAATLLLQGKNVYGLKSAMDKKLAGKIGASEYLKRLAIEEACQAGCRYYHMGETGRSTSLALYKRHLGADAYEYAEYFFERIPITPIDRKLRRMVKTAIGFKDAS